jgi:hypothetical protein
MIFFVEECMQRKFLFGVSGIAMMFVVLGLFAGCTTTHYYEKEAPIETQAILKWMGKEIKTVALDEVGTNWKVKSFMFGSFGQCIVYLPPGPHTLTVHYKSSLGKADAIHVGADFKAGHTYQLNTQLKGGLFGGSVSLSITEVPGTPGR